MTEPTHRVVAGLAVPLDLVPRLIAAIRARYPQATKDVADHDEAVQAALFAWAEETLTQYEEKVALAPLEMTIARTITDFEQRGKSAKAKAAADAQRIERTAVAPTFVVEPPAVP